MDGENEGREVSSNMGSPSVLKRANAGKTKVDLHEYPQLCAPH
jgi:hypothetical protein